MKANYHRESFIKILGDWGEEGPEERGVHVFTNCGDIALEADGKIITLSEQVWHRITLPFFHGSLRAHALENSTIRDELRPWSKATKLLIAPEPRDRRVDDVLPIRVLAVDDDGECDRGYYGDVAFHAYGARDVYYYRPESVVSLYAGVGRIYAKISNAGMIVRFRAEAAGLVEDEVHFRWAV